MASTIGKKTVNTFSGGMNLDTDKSLLKNNQYRYAENVRVITNEGANTGSLSNIEGNSLISGLNLNSGDTIIATDTIRNYGVIFTYNSTTNLNNIYRLVFDMNNPGAAISCTPLLGTDGLGVWLEMIGTIPISIVTRYENSDNIKVYYAVEGSFIRVINIAESNDTSNRLLTSSTMEIIPSAILDAPIVESLNSGKLNAGIIQYCYQLVAWTGAETELSPMSPIIHLTDSTMGSSNADYIGTDLGTTYGKPSSKSVRLKINIPTTGIFKSVKLISVYYFNYSDAPIITVVKDSLIPVNSSGFVYIEDGGTEASGELTQAELQAIGSTIFKTALIESKDNILFAANTIDDTWDLDYDTRAYQFNLSGTTRLHNAGGSYLDYSISTISTIDPTYDCIHDEIYSKDRYSDLSYIYNTSGKLGGTGVNVSYLYTNTYFIESYGDFWNKRTISTSGGYSESWANDKDKFIDQRTARIGDKSRSISSVKTLSSDGTSSDLSLSNLNLPSHTGFLNYSNPYLSNNFASYQRDEIYRFAAVFYDSKGRRSPAKWIADIRFPAGYIESTGWDASIFENPAELNSTVYNNTLLNYQELLVKPLGITFSFTSIPEYITKIEIVRAKRDINNKTVYAQGVVQKVGTYRNHKASSTSGTVYDITNSGLINSLRPHPVISMGHSLSVCAPVYNKVSDRIGITDVDATAFDAYNGTIDATDAPYNNNDASITTRLYTTDSVFPYFYNKNYLLFVNPETSFYGVDFVSQLKDITTKPTLDIVDLIYPISTPPVIGITTSAFGTAYLGDTAHNAMQFYPNSTSIRYATGMYLGADVNTKTYPNDFTVADNKPFITNGFAGTYYKVISGLSTDKAVRDNQIAPVIDEFDIVPQNIVGTWSELKFRTYISLGGIIYKPDAGAAYNHGINGAYSDMNPSAPAVLIDSANDNSREGFTFKYFGRYFKVKSGSSLGGTSIELITQNTNNYTDITTTSIDSLSNSGMKLSSTITEFEYSDDIDISSATIGDFMKDIPASKYVTIGGKQYLNFTIPVNHGDGAPDQWEFANAISKSKSMGTHGSGIVLNLEDSEQLPSISYIDQKRKKYLSSEIYAGYETLDKIISSGMSTFVTNFKVMNASIYGGASLIDRQFTEYISTGTYIDVASGSASGVVFGGDTYIGIFDYTITHATDPMVDGSGNLKVNREGILYNQIRNIGSLLPLESSINMHLASTKSFVSGGYNFAIQKNAGLWAPGASAGSKWTYSQKYPQFLYNSGYSSENSGIGYVSKLILSTENLSFDCRVWSSQVKTNGELYDNWSMFKAANRIDVETEYGKITRLKRFQSKLYFWQENAFGVLSVNERALINNGSASQLSLGTGGILSRFDYISSNNGMKMNTFGNLSTSNSGIYWFDHYRNELCTYKQGIEPLSKIKGIQTALNRSKDSITDFIPMIYDAKYNEIILTLNGLEDASSIN